MPEPEGLFSIEELHELTSLIGADGTREMFEKFFTLADQDAADAMAAFQAGDRHGVNQAAHHVAGAALGLSFRRIAVIAQSIERAENVSRKDLGDLSRAIAETSEGVEQWFGDQGSA
ncbi:Hpt domain-containing protein [Altererythrobacter arenosus]|uniref:Hpt domain-containing protein n=1 Tax=Altererythrobacter arenosus TaxID=3032592 RepID=A0ABY8FSW3_9SPHN|nr:Hpt domain-containing protein [Altererythrobacter sp. CAU 1644]WFL76161.1 Hpt domain-containing protein [Altererythrobacter sp. CAU 1644]